MRITTAEKEWLNRFKGTPEDPINKRSETHEVNSNNVENASDVNVLKKGHGFEDVAGMSRLKKMVTEDFINVLQHKQCADVYGIKPPSLLFYGPSGCGKTFFAEKIAEELNINFMKIIPDDLACKWIHGTQEKIGKLFREAEKKSPTLIFFDEFDAMVPKRSGEDSNQAFNGEVNEFLCMLNNASDRGIFIIAATNHPDRIDKAVLRPGRIDEMIYVDMPDVEARIELFKLALSKLPIDKSINYDILAKKTEGYTCSDIRYIVTKAAREMFNYSVKKVEEDYKQITQEILEKIIMQVAPSVSSKDIREYEYLHNEYSSTIDNKKSTRIGFR